MMFHHTRSEVKLYLVFPQTRLPWKHSRWYAALDLPPGIYWRQHRGQAIPDHERHVRPGETIELVMIEFTANRYSYYGLPYGSRQEMHLLRSVRLNADDTYTELFHSPEYEQEKAEGGLRDFDLAPWNPLPEHGSERS